VYSILLFAKKRRAGRVAIDCQIIPANIMAPKILINDPEELTIFHVAIESG